MIQITPHMRILGAPEPIDFRAGIDGLARICQQQRRPIRLAAGCWSAVAAELTRSRSWVMTARGSGDVKSGSPADSCGTRRKMINGVMRGSFLKDPALRREVLSLINLKN